MKKIFFFTLFLFSVQFLIAATCIATNGNWNSSSTWSCGHTPQAGDSLVIPAGITVNYTSTIDYGAGNPDMKLVVYGTLQFQNGKKLTLPCESEVFIMPGGEINPGGGGGNSNLIEICEIVLWTSEMGTVSGPAVIICCSPLPIELMYFTAIYNNGKTNIEWATATQTNNNYFTIERSIDAVNFQTIGTIDGAGNSNQSLSYSFIDAKPLKGTSYYRLKQTDFDGQFKYFKLAVITNNDNNLSTINIAPNPNNGHFFIEGAQVNTNLIILNSFGKKILNQNLFAEKTEIDLSNFSSGIYFVQINSEKESITQKIYINK